MQKLLTQYKNLTNWKIFVVTAILIRAAVFSFIITIAHHWHDIVLQYDDGSYFSAVDHFMQSGTYYYINNVPFAGRMPGYSLVYLLLRFLFTPHTSTIIMVILQFILSCISAYVLCLVSYKIFQNKTTALLTFFLFCIGTYPGIFDFWMTGESFSISAFIFSVYFFINSFENRKSPRKALFLSGLFLTWAIFLRPYIGLFIIIFPSFIIYYLYFRNTKEIKTIITALFFFCIPFVIAEGAWVIRNYILLHRFIPLEEEMDIAYGKIYSKPWLCIDHFVFNLGEDAANFDKGSLGAYYRYDSIVYKYPFPHHIFNKVTTYNADSLILLKKLYMKYLFSKDTTEDSRLEATIFRMCNTYENDYIAHNKLYFFFRKPLTGLKILTFSGGYRYLPYTMPESKISTQGISKIVSALFYFFIIFCGLIGIKYCIFKKVNLPYIVFLLLLFLTTILTIVFYSEIQEPRYFVHPFIILLLFAAYFLVVLFQRFTAKAS